MAFGAKRTIVALAISLLALAEIVDLTIVAVAIPQIMGAIGANVETIADVTTVYIVTAAIFILLSGLIIEKYGIKRVALVSSVIFGISSIMCGLSTSLAEMIVLELSKVWEVLFTIGSTDVYIYQL